ncbi:hypothetical protein N7472_005610, partial [Penicillium cf. griseofulvum]
LQQQSFLTSEIALPDIYEDAGHTLVHFFYSGNYETILSPPDIDTCGIAGEYKRSILVYHASRKCEIPGLECLAKHYVEHFGKELSLHDVLRLTRDVFSTLPEGETWLPNYIKSHLLRLKLGNPNNNLAELYSTLGHDHQFDNTVMKMVVDMLSVKLSDNALRDALWANGRCAAEEPTAEEPTAEEPVADEPVADEPVADEPVADEPADEPVADEPVADEPVADEPADEPVEEWIIPDASSHKLARNLVITLVRHYGSEKTVRKGYRPTALIQATLEHVTSPDTFITFFLTYIYKDLRFDEGHAVDSNITHALEPEQINKLHGGLEKFAKYIVENFLLPLRASSVKTPQPTPTSLSSLQSSTSTGTRQRISILRQKYLIRDRHRCVVSRKFDRAAARKRFEENAESYANNDGNLLKDKSSDQFQYLEVTHILPYCLTTVASGETDLSDSKKNALRILDIPINALTLTLDYHRLFGEFKIYFEPTGTRHQYRIDSTECSPFLRDPLFPVTRSLTLSPHRTVDPPSPRVFDIHRAIILIMKLSSASEYIKRVLRDIEELDVREDGSTHLGYLTGLRLGG